MLQEKLCRKQFWEGPRLTIISWECEQQVSDIPYCIRDIRFHFHRPCDGIGCHLHMALCNVPMVTRLTNRYAGGMADAHYSTWKNKIKDYKEDCSVQDLYSYQSTGRRYKLNPDKYYSKKKYELTKIYEI